MLVILFAVFLSLITAKYSDAFMDLAKITVKVVDESGSPVAGANVGIGFEVNTTKKEIPVNGVTNTEGRFSASSKCNGYIGFNVVKPGYYMSIGKYNFTYENKGVIKWEPWNPEITVVIRKIEKPVPMYAHDTNESRINIPVTGKEIGFDFIVYDWVKPYGKGKVSDLNCTLNVRSNGPRDAEYKVKINFAGQFNGIQGIEEDLKHGSEFKLPRFAPIDGYQKNVDVFIEFKLGAGGKWSYKKNMNYMFRIRSEVEKGKLTKAMYGKILGDFDIGTNMDGTAFLKFKYYLNPDYTTNLEFDPKRNLFKDLKSFEKVGL
jgi:hypothetical protein